MHDLVWFCVVGLLTGWIASLVVHGKGLGILPDMVVGILGAIIGGYLAPQLGIHVSGFLGALLLSIVGAVILLVLIRLIKSS